MKKDVWNLLRRASKLGWNGKITEWIEYDAPGVHLFGEHIFDAGGEADYGDYYYPPKKLPKHIILFDWSTFIKSISPLKPGRLPKLLFIDPFKFKDIKLLYPKSPIGLFSKLPPTYN